MKMYMLRNSDGLYLNTDYHTRWQQGNWRPREQARLYKSKQGIRSALAGIAFPAMKAHLGIENPAPPFGTTWSDVDRANVRTYWQQIASIKGQLWWTLLFKDGYVLEEVNI